MRPSLRVSATVRFPSFSARERSILTRIFPDGGADNEETDSEYDEDDGTENTNDVMGTLGGDTGKNHVHARGVAKLDWVVVTESGAVGQPFNALMEILLANTRAAEEQAIPSTRPHEMEATHKYYLSTGAAPVSEVSMYRALSIGHSELTDDKAGQTEEPPRPRAPSSIAGLDVAPIPSRPPSPPVSSIDTLGNKVSINQVH